MSALSETLRGLAEVLDAQKIGWYVFGAQAVAVRGAPRATQDVDVTVFVSQEDLPGLTEILSKHGFQHRYPDAADELLARGAVLPLVHQSGMEVDMVVAGSGLEELALERAERLKLGDALIPVAHATDLVVMKVLAGRGKDLEDVRALLGSGDVDVAEVRLLLAQLEEALGQSDLLPAFEAAVSEMDL